MPGVSVLTQTVAGQRQTSLLMLQLCADAVPAAAGFVVQAARAARQSPDLLSLRPCLQNRIEYVGSVSLNAREMLR